MSAPTAEERAAEAAAQCRFLDAILEALTSLPGDDLRQLYARSQLWFSLDGIMQKIIDQGAGRENVARVLLGLMLYKIVNRLLDSTPLDVGKTETAMMREVQKRVSANLEPITDSPQPQLEPEPITDEPQPQSTCTKLSDGRIQVAFVRPNGQVRNFIANRKRSRPRTYAEILARKTPEQQAEFRRKRRDIQRIYRASRKLALVPNS
jgi:hypothetical protein